MGASTIVIIVVFVLDLIAFGLGIGAEQRRATGIKRIDDTNTYQWCFYSSDIATGLGVGAMMFLMVAQVVVLVSTRCLCCGSNLKLGATRTFSILFFLFTWVCFIIAEACYMAGGVQNAKHIRFFSYITSVDPTCEAIRKGTFAAGVAFTFFTFMFSILYCICYKKAQEGPWRNQFNKDAGVTMAPYA